jgi:hypothetical protein
MRAFPLGGYAFCVLVASAPFADHCDEPHQHVSFCGLSGIAMSAGTLFASIAITSTTSLDRFIHQKETAMFDRIKNALTGNGEDGQSEGFEKYLAGVNFPISKDDLLVHLRDNGVDEAVIAHIESLSDAQFDSPESVFKTLTP